MIEFLLRSASIWNLCLYFHPSAVFISTRKISFSFKTDFRASRFISISRSDPFSLKKSAGCKASDNEKEKVAHTWRIFRLKSCFLKICLGENEMGNLSAQWRQICLSLSAFPTSQLRNIRSLSQTHKALAWKWENHPNKKNEQN